MPLPLLRERCSRVSGRSVPLPSAEKRIPSIQRHSSPAAISVQNLTINTPARPVIIMNNGTTELPVSRPRGADTPDELSKLKKELLQAEVRLAKARATVSGAEIDIKMINARLKAYTH